MARQFDPALGRFLQADTIIPDPANPQSLNRYSYTLGNPLRYTDPSGHIPEPPHRIPPHGMVYQPGDRRELLFLGETFPYSKMNDNVGSIQVSYGSLVREIDDYLWKQVPSTVGVYVKGDLSGGLVAGADASAGRTYLFNWRSGEMGVITGAGVEIGLYVGEETTWGGGAGLSSVRGASSLKACAGSDWSGSVSVDATAIIGGGIDYSKSYSASPWVGRLELDSYSGQHIIGENVGLSTGAGQGAAFKVTVSEPFMNYSWVSFGTDLPARLFSQLR